MGFARASAQALTEVNVRSTLGGRGFGVTGKGEMTDERARGLEDSGRAESLHDPLLYILTDHDRQRMIAASLDRLADELDSAGARDAAAYICGYLIHDLPLHVADEEEDLLPALARRVEPEDGLDALGRKVRAEHDADEAERVRLLSGLKAFAAGQTPPDPAAFSDEARRFAAQMRQHLAWENGTIMELARRRLAKEDLVVLAAGMARRRGLLPP